MTGGGPAPLSVKGVCLDAGGRVLVCRNWRREWELPGGRPELGEDLPACLRREIEEETGLRVDVRALVTAYPFEVLQGRWVTIVAYGCAPRAARRLHTSGEHVHVAFKHLAELSRREFPDGYRDAARLWQERRAMSHN
ncbi:MAG TPA: NUDIX hydrolase [Solirubrobacteraceae bacterium]|nr:NUDIX hydrolase [Solirubrobacteraceae bacterium]